MIVDKQETMGHLDTLAHKRLSMSPWELEFIDSCSDRKVKGGFFSQKQLDIINRIYTEYMT